MKNVKNLFSFQLLNTWDNARAGLMTTPHGHVATPIFMPVGTQASVKALDSLDLENAQASIILANTYHLYLRPGTETLTQQRGIHHFMNWQRPILTDSGGFQVFSLGLQSQKKEKRETNRTFTPSVIRDNGVEFTSHLDGSKHFFTPEKAIEIQRQIGADIIMAFDECTPDDADLEYTQAALDRTHRWAVACRDYWTQQNKRSVYGKYQALFGIIQGSRHQALRQDSARQIVSLGFDGIAVGGETIGYNMPATIEVMDWIRDLMPSDKPRYAMGLGFAPQNIIDAVWAGFDMFDCVAPTRLARNGALYFGELKVKRRDESREKSAAHESGMSSVPFLFDSPYSNGRLNIGNSIFSRDDQVVQKDCDCFTCRSGYSRAYLHHLYKTKELAYYRLASIHNVRFMIRLTEDLRAEILRGA